ncbi:MAG TPA: hypothetical protein VJL58_01405, partial [Pyrinomonadaceae bacterium]|nr:hypothetical protein [Pyrinomonadaceae bacterium]
MAEKKQTFTGLAAHLSRLPADKRRVALELSASLASVSLRVSREFVEAVPEAANFLSADDLRNWGELGRRLAMANLETGTSFFSEGAGHLAELPEASRPLLFQICTRQLVLSSSVALETYYLVPKLASEIEDEGLLESILALALEIAQRSAKHSSDFLIKTPQMAAALVEFGSGKKQVAEAVFRLASIFANRTGGMTADLWANLPGALKDLSTESAVKLAESGSSILEFGGSVTLHFVSSGSSVLHHAAEVFDHWVSVLRTIGKQGNAVLIAFLRETPKFFKQLHGGKAGTETVKRVLQLTGEIAHTDAESALAAFRSSTAALKKVTLEQFEEWIETGLRELHNESTKARRSYFALETRASNEMLRDTRTGLQLESVQNVLRIYIEGLTGKVVEVAPLSAVPQESRIGDGKTIYLPAAVAEFETEEKDFRLYKVLAAYGAGQIEFGTFDRDTKELKAAFTDLSEFYDSTAADRDAFSLAGYIEDVAKADRALTPDEYAAEKKKRK